MRYRNIKTGIEFTSSSVLSGDDYEEIKPTVSETAPKAEPIVKPKAPEKVVKSEKKVVKSDEKVVKSVKPVKKVKK